VPDRSFMSELTLMLRGLSAVIYKGANIDPLLDADITQELSTNERLRASAQKQEQLRRDYKPTLITRIQILRRNLFSSFFLLCTATAFAFLVLYLTSRPLPSHLGVASIFFLAWSTLARLGYSGKSWGGDTVIERLDERVFRFLFWVGTFLGMLALT
jgi:hypothetical protein